MNYISTRGHSDALPFRETVMAGMAPDGGLYLPERIPQVAERLAEWRLLDYPALCAQVMAPFIGDELSARTLEQLIARAYATFDDPRVTPLRQVGRVALVELFHGPTLAFKDVALQFLGNLFEHELAQRGRRMTVVGATSGDTGSAAIQALRGKTGVEVFILYPQGRVSPMQERQMTTVPDANIHAIAIEGSFDDAQAIVKALFADRAFNARYGLGAVNSINWARVLAQIVYFFYAYLRLASDDGPTGRPVIALGDPVRFAVPTGNFGHIFAGYVARRMGLPIERLILATNANDILHRFVQSGVYAKGPVVQTLSPSMDIQVASNFERYLFELADRDAALLGAWLEEFGAHGSLRVDAANAERLRGDFVSVAVDDAQTRETIAQVYREHGYLLDPHSAIGYRAAQAHEEPALPMVAMATAHPAKFAAAINAAIGRPPELPPALAALAELPTRRTVLPAHIDAVRAHITATVSG
ncbi:MAG: threonine synthase [Candidatus Lambdaproteobacteria bacterium]|nr:threonine synthase [Candidatus Lambdaproteobacteria bacterium]